ncbi:MAG: rhodanese-like domain-containing protein [Sphaerochaetaceae bacterium]|nr:rhodanese-like domain-containing protein [Sphaerochaetaceae bacterium]
MLKAEYHRINSREAKERIDNDKDIIIVDVRTEEEFSEGHIPNSINIPLSAVIDQAKQLFTKDTKLFIYCRSGVRSRIATSQLALMGFNKVYDFGGILSWPYDITK